MAIMILPKRFENNRSKGHKQTTRMETQENITLYMYICIYIKLC